MLGVGKTTSLIDEPICAALQGGSSREGRIYKYGIRGSRGSGIIRVSNNVGGDCAIVAYANTGNVRSAQVLYKTGDNWGHIYRDDDGYIYVQHHQTWGNHLIDCSSELQPEGYVTDTTGLTLLV